MEKPPLAHKTAQETNRLCVLHHDRANAAVPSKTFGRTTHSETREGTVGSLKNALDEKVRSATKLVPTRRLIEPDIYFFFVLFDVVPFPVRVPTRRDDLHQNFPSRHARYLHAAILIRFEINLRFLVFVREESFALGKADIHAGIRHGLTGVGCDDAHFKF